MKKDKRTRRGTRAGKYTTKKSAVKTRAAKKGASRKRTPKIPAVKTRAAKICAARKGTAKKHAPKIPAVKSSLFKQIQKCINGKIRPFIQMDGGDIEIITLTPRNVLKVRLHGACCGCPATSYTLQYGVQNALDEEFPDEDIKVFMV